MSEAAEGDGPGTGQGGKSGFTPVLRIAMAIVTGASIGLLLGERAVPLGRVGTTILDVIKGLAGPLLFVAIVDAFVRTEIRGRDVTRMLGIAAINAVCALGIGLGLSNLFHPGRGFLALHEAASRATATDYRSMASRVEPSRKIDVLGEILSYLPTSLVRPFLDNAIISIAILAVIAGCALRRVLRPREGADPDPGRVLTGLIVLLYEALVVVLGWCMTLIPVAILCMVARAVASNGFRPFLGLIPYLLVGIGGLLIQVFGIYQAWIVLGSGWSLGRFWRASRAAVATAFGTGSSLATLPVTLEALDRMKVSPRAARLAACVGTNFNNDGILLYEAMAVLFVAQAAGIDLSVSQQVLVAVNCTIAGVGISGIPDAGLISLLIVLKSVDLPESAVAQILPFLLAVDWLMGRCRAATNVVSDLLVAVLIDRPGQRDIEKAGNDPSGI